MELLSDVVSVLYQCFCCQFGEDQAESSEKHAFASSRAQRETGQPSYTYSYNDTSSSHSVLEHFSTPQPHSNLTDLRRSSS